MISIRQFAISLLLGTNRSVITLIVLFIIAVSSNGADAEGSTYDLNGQKPEAAVVEPHEFFGLAAFYNTVSYFAISVDKFETLDLDGTRELGSDTWLAVAGRYNVLVVKARGLAVSFKNSGLVIDNPEVLSQPDTVVLLVKRQELSTVAPELDQIRYNQLLTPLAWLARSVEFTLVAIQRHIVSSWGLAIILFSVLFKILLLPVNAKTIREQRRVSQLQTELAPKIAIIKRNFDGQEAHERLMAAYADLGISPFFTMRPLLGMFVQVPILIAIFNALGEMSQLAGTDFLWTDDLGYPDAVATFGFSVSMIGNSLNIWPLLMTAITTISTLMYEDRHAPPADVRNQKRNLHLMALGFLVLFYPFPAAMVLFWMSANVLQMVQQKYLKV